MDPRFDVPRALGKVLGVNQPAESREHALTVVASSVRLRQRRLVHLPIEGPGAPYTALQGRMPDKSTGNEGIAELVTSIGSVGLLQPILVEAMPDERNRLVAGERRLLAFRRLTFNDPSNPHVAEGIPAIVCDGPLEETERRAWQFAENFCRADLSISELGLALMLERCALLTERLGEVGVEIPAEVADTPEPSNRFRALDALRVRCDQTQIGAPWPDVIARLGVQISESRARSIVRAFQSLPPDMGTELDEHGVALAARSEFCKLHSEKQTAASALWDAVKARRRPDLLAAAVKAQTTYPDKDAEFAVDTAEAVHALADQARSQTQLRAAAVARGEVDAETAANGPVVVDALRRLLVELRGGARLETYVAGSLRLLTAELAAMLAAVDAQPDAA